MTENKRFTNVEVDDYYNNLICVNDGDIFHSYSEKGLEDLLNELSDENRQLKEEKNYFKRKKCQYFNKYNKTHLDNIQLKEMNEELKEENKRLKRLLGLTAPHQVIDINKLIPIIAECRGITVEEYLEEIEKEYTKGGMKE